MIDQTSLAILDTLQSDARISNAEIGRRVGLAPSAVFERIKKLEERGAVRGYNANIDPAAVDLNRDYVAFMSQKFTGFPGFQQVVQQSSRQAVEANVLDLIAQAQSFPGLPNLAGRGQREAFLAVQVSNRTQAAAALNDLLANQIGSLESVRSTKTTIVLRTAKETSTIPIASPELARSREAGDDNR